MTVAQARVAEVEVVTRVDFWVYVKKEPVGFINELDVRCNKKIRLTPSFLNRATRKMRCHQLRL